MGILLADHCEIISGRVFMRQAMYERGSGVDAIGFSATASCDGENK